MFQMKMMSLSLVLLYLAVSNGQPLAGWTKRADLRAEGQVPQINKGYWRSDG